MLNQLSKKLITFYHTILLSIFFLIPIRIINGLSFEYISQIKLARKKRTSQLLQDIFVLYETGFKREGYFVEFGATNGFDLSNTYMLEKEYSWNGILAEPAKIWQTELNKNRSCIIENRCVWIDSKLMLEFTETKTPELSTLSSFKDNTDWAATRRQNSNTYTVETISLNDMLEVHKAPRIIDYLSIDTEGSEYQILSNFNFSKYKIKIITCEHNYTSERIKIYKLLIANGYKRKYSWLSKWDDWYVLHE